MSDSFLKKVRRDEELKELRKRRKKLKHTNNYRELSDIYCQMGDCLRNLYRQASFYSASFEAKIARKYENCIEMGKLSNNFENCSLASRSLAEMTMNKDSEDAFTNIENSMRYALKAKNPSFIQLAFHQCAYIFSTASEYLEKAAEIAERGLVYLRDHATEINADEYEVKSGGDSSRRKAGLENLLGGIYLDLGNEKMARLHNDRCLDYTCEGHDRELHCRGLMLKLRMTMGSERLSIAMELKETAQKITDKNSELRFEADFFLGTECLRFNEFLDAKRILWRLHVNHLNRLDEDSRLLVNKYLVFIYKSERRLERIASEIDNDNSEATDRHGLRAQIYEKIADEAADLQLNELAFHFYEKMLKSCATVEQKRLALVSLAETAREMKEFSLSAHFFRELLKTERKLGFSDAKLLLTEISIAIVSANVSNISLKERLELFEQTYRKCSANVDKENLLLDFVEFLEEHPTLYTNDELSAKRSELEVLKILNGGGEMSCQDESDSQSSTNANSAENLLASTYTDLFDHMNELEIFIELKAEMKRMEEEAKLTKCVDAKVNNEGETRLHEVARSEDYEMLKKLVQKGYNVNAKDHGGWTPLSEAVSAGQLRNARFLLQNGANVNCRSIQGMIYSDGEEGASGYTPLMEACESGNIPIIRMLMAFKANPTQMDDNGWTAVDYLSEFLKKKTAEGELTGKERNEVTKCLEFMKNQQIKAGYTPRTSSPPHLRKPKKFTRKTTLKNSMLDSDEENDGTKEVDRNASLKRHSNSTLLEDYRSDANTLRNESARGGKFGVKFLENEDDFNSDDSMDQLLKSLCDSTKTKVVKKPGTSEDERNLREYQRMIQAVSRRQQNKDTLSSKSVAQQRAFAASLADAADRNLVTTYNKTDEKRESLPADRKFLAPEFEDIEDKCSSQRRSLSTRSGSTISSNVGNKRVCISDEEMDEDEIFASIRERQLKRRRII